jgi:hypothetical protein
MRWIPSDTHSTSDAFKARQKARMAQVEKQRKLEERKPIVVQMRKGAK